MKPNFALSLSFDGLRLMHRVQGGWTLVGEVPLDDADLTGALASLRAAALVLEPGGITTKILIPNDQIKYIAIDTTRAEDDDVRAALDGATPYGVDDLSYDFAKGGGRTYVAAVARETLQEARQFATEYGFNPVSFAAVPEPFTYVGEAFFGAVDGHDSERDNEPVVVIGMADVTPDHNVQATPEADEPDMPATGEPAGDGEADVEQPDPDTDTTDDTAPDEIEFSPDPEPADFVDDVPLPDTSNEPHFDTEAQPGGTPEADVSSREDEPDNLSAQTPVFSSRLRADRTDGAPANDAERTARAEPTLRRSTPDALAVPSDQDGEKTPPLFAPSRTREPSNITAPIATTPPEPESAPAITGDAVNADAAVASAAAASLTVDPIDAPDDTERDEKGAASTVFGAATAVGGAMGGMFASRRMARKAAEPAVDAQTPNTTTSKRSVFGARKKPAPKPAAVVGGKPRFLGLILTAILILFMLAIAAFAALSEEGFARWFGFGTPETQIATPLEVEPAALPAPEVAEPTPVDDAPVLADDAMATPIIAPTGGRVLTPEEAQRIYAATGVWQKAPRIPLTPRTTSIDAMQLAVESRAVTRVPASPLLDASSGVGDAVIATPVAPPPPSQQFDFGDDGLIVATPDGALTPDGTLVIVGRPALNPPTRPGTIAPEITPQDQLAAVTPDTAEPVADAPEGVIVIAGAPSLRPPVRSGTVAPAPVITPNTIADGPPPLVATDGLLVLSGPPPVLPPARSGTRATPVAPAVIEPAVTEPNAAIAQVAPPEAVLPDVAVPDVAVPDVETPDSVTPDTTALAPATPPLDPQIAEGLNVILGPPPVLPPARPGTSAPQIAATPDPVETLGQDVALALDTPTAQVPTAQTRRPLVRPASVTQAAVDAVARPNLGNLTPEQAAGFRPRTRPAGLAPPAPATIQEDAAVQTPSSGLQIAPEIAAAVQAAADRPNPIVDATPSAVPVSTRPDPRPRNMARIVARATQAQQRAATQVAAIAPRTVAPSGPTAGSVAQNATQENAINLREINLIGIYGGSADRRALVRLGNGRYLRLTVGDRLDGGRVTAISSDALSYTKRGQAVTLQVAG